MNACCTFFKDANPTVKAKLLDEVMGEVQLEYVRDFILGFVHDMDNFCPSCGSSLKVKQKGLPEPVVQNSSADDEVAPRKISCRYCRGSLKDSFGQCKGCLGTGDDRKGVRPGIRSIG